MDGTFDLAALGKLAPGRLINMGALPSLPSESGVPGLPFDPASYYVGAPDPGAIEYR